MIRKFLAATAVLMAASASALAADLPSRRPPPVYAPIPVFTWTGFYVGGDIGYTWGTDTHTLPSGAVSQSTPQGEIGGLHVGYNYQINQFVVGLEGDVDGLNFSNSNTLTSGNASFYESTRIPVEGSIRGRLGYAWDHLLFFATGGAAFGDIQHQYAVTAPAQGQFVNAPPLVTTYDPNNPYSSTRVGWTVGGGVEYALSNNWSVRGEYRYTDFGRSSDYLASIGQTITNHVIEHRVTVGFSYKFDMYAPPAPVVAKY